MKEDSGLISRFALLEDVYASMEDNPHKNPNAIIAHRVEHAHFIHMINKAYSADIHGKWVGGYTFDKKDGWSYQKPHCSICLKENTMTGNFCSNCGAKMDLEDKDE